MLLAAGQTRGWFCIKQYGCIASGGLCLRKLHGSLTTEVQILYKLVLWDRNISNLKSLLYRDEDTDRVVSRFYYSGLIHAVFLLLDV